MAAQVKKHQNASVETLPANTLAQVVFFPPGSTLFELVTERNVQKPHEVLKLAVWGKTEGQQHA